ncbi:MAG: hemolysin family protein [Planctomycetota bacterium]|nr:hemolysin family protein [Planctomycetota bacterium]
MLQYLTIGGVVAAALLSLIFSSLTYSLREYSRARLAEFLGKRDWDHWFESITDHTPDLTFLTAVCRQFCNILMFVLVFSAFEYTSYGRLARYGMTMVVAAIIAVFCSIAVPHAAAKYAGAEVVGLFAPVLNALRIVFSPLTSLMHGTDDVMRRALGAKEDAPETQIEDEILSAVEEGEKEGVVDGQEREMIESVMEFHDTTVSQIMTMRQDVVALPIDSTLEMVKQTIDRSGHSRVPIFEGTLDHIIGILYARDLIEYLGVPDVKFDVKASMRPAIYVPETKSLRDLLKDLRLQKVHIAVVLDEYGSTGGIVTIEDILEELVGEIADEHEPSEPAMFKRIDDRSAEADAKIRIEEFNRLMGITLPEDAGYESLGGFLSTSLAKIPEKGAVFEFEGVRYTVLDAQPQRVNRVKIELVSQPQGVLEAGKVS